jgi:hypothetical protein
VINTTRRGVRLASVAAALPAALSLGGCAATIKSTPLTQCSGAAACSATSGFVYSLPKGQYYLQASRLPVGAPDVTAAATAFAAANTVVKKDQSDISTAETTVAKDKDSAKTKPADLAADQATLDGLNAGLVADQALLDLAQDTFNRAKAGLGKGTETFTLSQLSIVPDPKARFSANINHTVLRDDTLKIDGGSGLLTSANTSSTDQSLNSLVSLIQTGIALATFASTGIPLVPPSLPKGAPPKEETTPPPFKLACTYQVADYFDPLDPTDVARVNGELIANHATIRLDVHYAPDASGGMVARTASEAAASQARSGLFYRTATTAIVTIRPVGGQDQDSSDRTAWVSADSMWNLGGPILDFKTPNQIPCPLVAKPVAMSQLAVLPDSRTVFRIDADAGAFTTTTHSYVFTNGMLTEHQASRPSEVAAPVQALSTLAQAVMAIPGSILKLRLDFATNSDALVKAQTTLATDRINVLTSAYAAKSALDTAQASYVTAQFATPQAFITGQTNLIKAQQSLQMLINSVTPPGTAAPPAAAPLAVVSPSPVPAALPAH